MLEAAKIEDDAPGPYSGLGVGDQKWELGMKRFRVFQFRVRGHLDLVSLFVIVTRSYGAS